MNYERNKQYDGTILHGLQTKNKPALKPKQCSTPRRKNVKSKLESNINEGKPSAGIPRYKVPPQILESAILYTLIT